MKVRIYQPAKTATQSGQAKTGYWVIAPEPQTGQNRDALLGWFSAGQPETQVQLRFNTYQDAVAHAKKCGWDYEIAPAYPRAFKPKSYAANFQRPIKP
jgi:hypothetical protein